MLPAIDKQIMNSTRRASGEGAGSGMGETVLLIFYWWIGGYKDGGLGKKWWEFSWGEAEQARMMGGLRGRRNRDARRWRQ